MGRDLPVMVTEVPLTRLCEPLSISYDVAACVAALDIANLSIGPSRRKKEYRGSTDVFSSHFLLSTPWGWSNVIVIHLISNLWR